MKKNTGRKWHEALVEAGRFTRQLEEMDDRKLSRRLDLFQQQMQMAYEQDNLAAHKLLSEYYRQTVRARVNKNTPFEKPDPGVGRDGKQKEKNIRPQKLSSLQQLIAQRDENIQSCIHWPDERLLMMISRCRENLKQAREEGRAEECIFLVEKLAQLMEAENRKFQNSDEAGDWLHW